jgi:cell division protein FtsL
MTDCCELARQALYVIAGAFGVILALLIMFFGYNLRLDRRTLKLEKKNGHEQEQINQLKEEIKQLKRGDKN